MQNNPSKFALLNRIKRKPVPGIAVQDADAGAGASAGADADADAEVDAGADDERQQQAPPLPPRRPQTSGAETPGINRGGTGQIQRQAWNDAAPPPYEESRLADFRGGEPTPPALPRRPLPPLPGNQEQEQGEINNLGQRAPDTRRWSALPASSAAIEEPPLRRWHEAAAGRASWDGGRPSLRPDRSKGFLLPTEMAARNQNHNNNNRQPPPLGRPRRSCDKPRESIQLSPPFHITLIRRDPTHGHQWNVGSIKNASENSPKVAADGTVTVEITTPGYKKLAVDNTGLSFESLGIKIPTTVRSSMPLPPELTNRPASSNGQPDTRTSAPAAPPPPPPSGPLKFIRHLSLSLTPPPPHHNNNSHRPQLPQEIFSSLSSLSPPKLPNNNPNNPTRARGHYTFKSPWNGHCFFITSANGRSLKCRHILPGPSSSSPASSSSTTTPSSPQSSASPLGQAGYTGPPVNVAEIRFNLPAFQTPGHHHNHSGGNGGSDARLQPPFESDRLDLSLARERAGGGLFGKSAKLGKLIIEDEGLKMLDLIVAACMGVFWGYYDQA